MSRFIHLHTHSHYSFLEALPKLDELVAAAKKGGMEAVGLTDAGNMHGAIEFYKAAEDAGIKPILGVDTYVAPRSRFEKDRALDAKRSRIVLIAENIEGYKNLLAIVTKSYVEGFFEKPRVDKELLRAHSKGVIAIIPSFAGEVPLMLAAGDMNGAAASLAEYKSIFAKGKEEDGSGENLFLEITHHPSIEGHEAKMEKIIELSKTSGVPLVAQHDVYYLKPSDRDACEVMRRIQHGARGRNEQEDFSFISEKEAIKLFKNTPEAIDASRAIADRCNISFELGKWIFPNIPTKPGLTHAEELREKTFRGITARGLSETPEVLERIEYELGIINTKGFAPYFLAISDLLTFAKSAGILTTTRGSAAGSLVGYLTGISNVDPLFYKLPFERFLNPERPKAPDIDMDIADNRRDEMIAYAKRKYGDDHVAQIGTFGTLAARAAVRDVARALGHSYSVGDRIAKLIPIGSQGFPMTIDRALQIEKDLKTLYNEDDDAKEVIDLAKQIEGCVRHVGVHAAGVVIAPTPLVEWTALQPDPKSTDESNTKLITQYDMYSISDEYGGVGLLKFDFLGIKNLSILSDAVDRVRESLGVFVDIETVPIDDPKTFAMLARGETEGLFQLSGSGMTRYLKELKPTTIHDINAMVALYRPGPMDVIPEYIERKQNPKLVKYLDPRMENFLKESYGLLVYQDDLLYCAVQLAGYSWLEVDKFRKAIGKKNVVEMAKQKKQFTEGIVTHGQTAAFADKLWQLFEPFQAYGFNKAHAASYGKVAYQTAYMKANYPVHYMAAVLTADAGDTESISTFVNECERMQIPVLPPDVNESGSDFTVNGEHKDTIRFGLTTIKNFGEGISQAIIKERNTHGPFVSLSDFLCRIESRNLNKKGLEALIKCGALDRFADEMGGRSILLTHMETLLAFHRDATTSTPDQNSLFGAMAKPSLLLPPPPQDHAHHTSLKDKLEWEKELLGIYVSGHPLDAHTDKVAKAATTIADILVDPKPGKDLILPVLVAEVRPVLTKGGDKMAFVRFEDKTESIEAVIFPKLYKEHTLLVTTGTCLLIKGKVSIRNGETSFAVENLKAL
jgi:DNA polymerase-3 subunit alpha